MNRETLSATEVTNSFPPTDYPSTNAEKAPQSLPHESGIETSLQLNQSNIAISVRNGVKKYGLKGPSVLKDFNMTVNKGTIYSLLGSSGCGKTTLLSCVVGIKRLNSGSVSVFGVKPGSKGSGIPGRRVGYMPQEIALYRDFSIKEMIQYYGAIYGMAFSESKAHLEFLVGFLGLPPSSRRIGTLSGGQQRRVSIALALIHSPQLLILDEPTVGVDPLLRQNIWKYLHNIVNTQGITVVITTHYTEEARGSHKIGLMRDGRLLAEKSPDELLTDYNTTLLEDVVIQLCLRDSTSPETMGATVSQSDHKRFEENIYKAQLLSDAKVSEEKVNEATTNVSTPQPVIDVNIFFPYKEDRFASLYRIKASVLKNIVIMVRNFVLILFLLGMPALQVLTLCMAIGNDPKPLDIGIVNKELPNNPQCLKGIYKGKCPWDKITNLFDGNDFSCRFLAELPRDIVKLREFATESEAKKAVEAGDTWGYILFHKEYSVSMWERMSSNALTGISSKVLDTSTIQMSMDMTSKQILAILQRIFRDSHILSISKILEKCGANPQIVQPPLLYSKPIYGNRNTDFREYVAPGVLMGVIFYFPLCSSSISYIHDKKLGTLERAMVAGVKTWEIMLGFFVTETCILLLQTIIAFLILTVLYDIEIKGSYPLAVTMTILVGLGGVSMGFLISSYCSEEIEAVLIALAAFLPNLLLSGMLWPIEGMPKLVQYIAYILPCTLPNETMRSIISRGWGITHRRVWLGFVSTIGWIVLYWTLTLCLIKFSRSRL